MMELLKQELNEVKNSRDILQETCQEQESTINDLAEHLGEYVFSILKWSITSIGETTKTEFTGRI